MEITSFFHNYLENPNSKKYLLAVSGGVDSMVLFHLLLKTGFYFEVCHVNFQLRGTESDSDQHFVEQTCHEHQILCHVIKADTIKFAKTYGLSKQEAARNIRYKAFQEICTQRNLDFILTAHHLNDQTENLIYTFIKSSYHQVFEPIPFFHKNILRPLLPFTKQQIFHFAHKNQIAFREDSSNLKNDYSRNKIRNQIIPILKEINPNLENFLQKKWKNQAIKEEFLQNYFQKIYENHFQIIHPKVQILTDTNSYFQDKPNELLLFFQYLIDSIFHIKHLSDEQLYDLWNHSQKGKVLMDKEWYIFKEKESLSFVHQEIVNYTEELTIKEPGNYKWNIFEVKLDSKKDYPLKIRKWKPGDRLGNQKLSDYFTKQQYPAWLKKMAFVVESQNGDIIQVQQLKF